MSRVDTVMNFLYELRDYIDRRVAGQRDPGQKALSRLGLRLLDVLGEPTFSNDDRSVHGVPPDQLCKRLECEHPLSLHVPIETPRIERACLAMGCGCSYWQMSEPDPLANAQWHTGEIGVGVPGGIQIDGENAEPAAPCPRCGQTDHLICVFANREGDRVPRPNTEPGRTPPDSDEPKPWQLGMIVTTKLP